MTSPAARLPQRHQVPFKMGFDFPFPGTGGAGVAATGLITCVANASMADSDYITVGDGMNPAVLYEYDKSADGVTGGRVAWAVGTTAATVAANLRTAILANQPGLSVTDNLDGTLTIAHKWLGTGGNVTITENVANAGFLVAGLSGGANPTMASTLTADSTVKLHKVKGRALKITRVHLNLPLGLAAHASNYVNIKLLKGASTVVANWSTLTGQQGTLTADTPAELVLSATAASLNLVDGDQLSMFFDVTGSPTVPAGRFVVEGIEL